MLRDALQSPQKRSPHRRQHFFFAAIPNFLRQSGHPSSSLSSVRTGDEGTGESRSNSELASRWNFGDEGGSRGSHDMVAEAVTAIERSERPATTTLWKRAKIGSALKATRGKL